MARKMICPFTRRSCMECALYRGRHCYLGCRGSFRNLTGESRKEKGLAVIRPSVDLGRLRDPLKRTTLAETGPEKEPKIMLKITDIETDETRICELDEAATWDWTRPQMLRLVDGWQVSTLDHLIAIARGKVAKGCRELEICEAPRFMLFSGG